MVSSVTKLLKEEFQTDTRFHVVLSVAVGIKLIFLICAVISFYETRNGNETSQFTKKILKLKDISNELVKIIVCLLMVFLFYPRSNTYCIDKPMKMLLFSYAIISLFEVNWAALMKTHPAFRMIQYFTGRVGTFQEQNMRDELLSAK
jgi:amino acid permease